MSVDKKTARPRLTHAQSEALVAVHLNKRWLAIGHLTTRRGAVLSKTGVKLVELGLLVKPELHAFNDMPLFELTEAGTKLAIEISSDIAKAIKKS